MKPLLLSAIVLSLCLVVSCGSSPEPVAVTEPTVTPTSTPPPPTETPTPTETLTPTSTHTPVPPTDTPTPEPPTSTPTEVPPTATPEPPTPEPSPTLEPTATAEPPAAEQAGLPGWVISTPDKNEMQFLHPDGTPTGERQAYDAGTAMSKPTPLRLRPGKGLPTTDGELSEFCVFGREWTFMEAADLDVSRLNLLDKDENGTVEFHSIRMTSGQGVTFFLVEKPREDFDRLLQWWVENDGLIMVIEIEGVVFDVGFPGLVVEGGHPGDACVSS